jgi:hypothetical protein
MRSIICLAIAVFFLCGLSSCHKTGTAPHPTSAPIDSTLSVNLTYSNADTASVGTSYELIISESGGKVLLDTIAVYNVPVIAKMTTTKAAVNVTTVTYSAAYDYYSVNIYTSVQPAKWDHIPGNSSAALSYPIGTPAKIIYTNAPDFDPNSTHFSSLPAVTSTGYNILYDNPNHRVTINYDTRPANQLYILYPPLGLYNYQAVDTTPATISLAQMDTTAKVFFNMPPQYTLGNTFMTGYLDTTDLTKYQSLYGYDQHLAIGDLQYPPQNRVPFQKYALNLDVSTATEYVNYQTYGSTPLPAGAFTLPRPATPIYTLNATANDNFSVSFSQRPTDYGTDWAAGKVYVTIIAPPDSAQIKALPLLTALNSRLLQGQTLGTLAIQDFKYENISGVDYLTYFLHQTSSTPTSTNPFASYLLYVKSSP